MTIPREISRHKSSQVAQTQVVPNPNHATPKAFHAFCCEGVMASLPLVFNKPEVPFYILPFVVFQALGRPPDALLVVRTVPESYSPITRFD